MKLIEKLGYIFHIKVSLIFVNWLLFSFFFVRKYVPRNFFRIYVFCFCGKPKIGSSYTKKHQSVHSKCSVVERQTKKRICTIFRLDSRTKKLLDFTWFWRNHWKLFTQKFALKAELLGGIVWIENTDPKHRGMNFGTEIKKIIPTKRRNTQYCYREDTQNETNFLFFSILNNNLLLLLNIFNSDRPCASETRMGTADEISVFLFQRHHQAAGKLSRYFSVFRLHLERKCGHVSSSASLLHRICYISYSE